nr:putative reverse transcriptase domain, aspartic peptidase domain protein [Tanacetum cinerariifolium]
GALQPKSISAGIHQENGRTWMIYPSSLDSWKYRFCSSGLRRHLPLRRVDLFLLLCYVLSLYPFTERYAQPYFFSCFIRQERECKLYDEFDKFAYKRRETLRKFYLRFSLLLNDMNIYNMKPEQFQVNTKFLNTLPPEWSKFVTNVKLVRDLHTTNVDQLHAYLGQHEFHVNEGRQTYLAVGTSRTYTTGASGNNSRKQRTIICYNCKGEGHMSKQCTKPKRKQDDSWFKDKVLLVQAQANSQILHEEELVFLADPRIAEAQATKAFITHNATYQADDLDAYDSDCDKINTAKVSLMANLFHYGSGDLAKVHNHDNVNHNVINQDVQKAQQLEPKLYDGNVIEKTNAIVIRDSEETLMLAEESRSKMLLKQKDPKMSEKKVNTTPNSVNSPKPTHSSIPTKVEVPKALPKVSMNTTAVTPGQADKKPGASGCVFAITEGHAANTSEHHATIDCRSYQVIFGDIHAPEFIYHGSLPGQSMQIIFALQARTLLSHGCEGFLATIHDMTPEIPSIYDQPVVLEFPDVFLDELPGIPPVREVEFNIELELVRTG